MAEPLCDPVLIGCGISHGFGQRGSQVPENTSFPKQVHGRVVRQARDWEAGSAPEADAIVSSNEISSVGIVTADCVPILVATPDGSRVAAIHAGWRGLAAGVIEAGVEALHGGGRLREALVAAIGPAARSCCYEVDEPVIEGLSQRYSTSLSESTLRPTWAGHAMLDLPVLATEILISSGLTAGSVGTQHRVCTICDGARFESYRREGARAGRLQHFIVAR